MRCHRGCVSAVRVWFMVLTVRMGGIAPPSARALDISTGPIEGRLDTTVSSGYRPRRLEPDRLGGLIQPVTHFLAKSLPEVESGP